MRTTEVIQPSDSLKFTVIDLRQEKDTQQTEKEIDDKPEQQPSN